MVIVDSSGRILTRQAAKANTRLDADARTAAVPNDTHHGAAAKTATTPRDRIRRSRACAGSSNGRQHYCAILSV
jgi:hypothetical protein